MENCLSVSTARSRVTVPHDDTLSPSIKVGYHEHGYENRHGGKSSTIVHHNIFESQGPRIQENNCKKDCCLSVRVSYPILSGVHFSPETTCLQIYSDLLPVCSRSLPQTWSIQRILSQSETDSTLSSLGRQRIRPCPVGIKNNAPNNTKQVKQQIKQQNLQLRETER